MINTIKRDCSKTQRALHNTDFEIPGFIKLPAQILLRLAGALDPVCTAQYCTDHRKVLVTKQALRDKS